MHACYCLANGSARIPTWQDTQGFVYTTSPVRLYFVGKRIGSLKTDRPKRIIVAFFYSQRQTIDRCINLLSHSPFAIKTSNAGSLTSFRCPPCTDFATYTARLPRSCLNHQGSEWRGLRFMSRGSSKQPFAAFIWQSPLSDFASRFAFPHYHSHPTPQHLKSASN